jgi:hypothetical protein
MMNTSRALLLDGLLMRLRTLLLLGGILTGVLDLACERPTSAPSPSGSATAPEASTSSTAHLVSSPPTAAETPTVALPAPLAVPTRHCELAGEPKEWRYSPALTRLADGRVLITGGRHHDGYDYLREAELYDPKTRTFSVLSPMKRQRAMHRAVRLTDGRVLVGGGLVAEIELFDPAKETFQVVAKLPYEAVDVAIAALPDGRAVLAGGDYQYKGYLAPEAFVFDATKRKLEQVAKFKGAIGFAGGSSVLLSPTKVAFLRGQTADAVGNWEPASALLDIAARSFALWEGPHEALDALKKLPFAEIDLLGVVTEDGGALREPLTVASPEGVWVFSRSSKQWSRVAEMAKKHVAAALLAVDERTLLVLGGLNKATSDAELCPLP